MKRLSNTTTAWWTGRVTVAMMMVATAQAAPEPKRGWTEVDESKVEVRDGFWGPRLKTASQVTLPHALDCLEKDGHVTNFDKAAGKFDGPLKGHHAFDSDLHKALEGSMYSLEHINDPALRRRVDDIVSRILAAQQKDGFLISWFIVNELDKRWDELRLEHQMYNAGHFFEMAVAQQRLTGEPVVLDAAKRFADHIDSVFGPDKRYDVDGHEEVELALVKLYRATGERRYLELARFFLDERGHAHGMARLPFDPKTAVMPVKPEGKLTEEQEREYRMAKLKVRNGRMQDHKPLVEQFDAVGHAVRAGYVYSAMADVVRFMEAPGYENALDHLWSDLVGRKIYLTGAIGTAQYGDEGFGDPYLLPNESAYSESCASIANVLWQHRMNLLKGEAKYADVMELSLYNAVLAGISIQGDGFFYQNPLASRQGANRSSWIGLSCCPTNLARIIPQVGGLAYAHGPGRLAVNLYVAGQASVPMDQEVKITQETDYPWDGRIKLTVSPVKPSTFDLCLRIPGWATGHPVPSDLYQFTDTEVPKTGLMLNGTQIEAKPEADGYVHLSREWHTGDMVELNLPMPVRLVRAHAKVAADQDKLALMRGPIIYCVEAADHPQTDMSRLTLPLKTSFETHYRSDMLGGVTLIEGQGNIGGESSVKLTAIPYYAWANRAKGAMKVWIDKAPFQMSPAGKK